MFSLFTYIYTHLHTNIQTHTHTYLLAADHVLDLLLGLDARPVDKERVVQDPEKGPGLASKNLSDLAQEVVF